MTEKLKVHSPYDGHLIKEIDLDDEARIEQALTAAKKTGTRETSANAGENCHPE